jgi:hypothetical protein
VNKKYLLHPITEKSCKITATRGILQIYLSFLMVYHVNGVSFGKGSQVLAADLHESRAGFLCCPGDVGGDKAVGG